MVRSAVAILLALVLAAAAGAPPAAAASEATAAPIIDRSELADRALIEALHEADLLDAWLASAPGATGLSLLRVEETAQYAQHRTELLASLRAIAASVRIQDADRSRLDTARRQAELLEWLAAQLRRRAAEVELEGVRRLDIVSLQAAKLVATQSELATPIGSSSELLPLEGVAAGLATARNTLVEQMGAVEESLRHNRAGEIDIAGESRVPTQLRSVRRSISAAELALEKIDDRIDQARLELLGDLGDLHRLRRQAATPVAGLTMTTLDAYVRGSEHGAACGVDWRLLAGIGRIESRHGTIDGGSVLNSGDVSDPIFGPLLDGGETARRQAQLEAEAAAALAAEIAAAEFAAAEAKAARDAVLYGPPPPAPTPTPTPRPSAAVEAFDPRDWGLVEAEERSPAEGDEAEGELDERDEFDNGFAVIVDTDGGRLDGDAEWDRAIGPMQFIPETWERWKTDGNADGRTDPQNLYDAAAAAARFLCHLEHTRGGDPEVFVLGYNRSERYVESVLAIAGSLDATVLPAVLD